MFFVVTNVVNYFVTVIQWVFLLTSFLGQIIVKTLTTTCLILSKSAEKILQFFRVIYEDNFTIFAEELPKAMCEFVDFFVIHFLQVLDDFSAIGNNVVNNVKAITDTISLCLKAVLLFASDIIFLLKICFVFLGETMWLMLTLPLQLPLLLEGICKIIKDFVHSYASEAYMNLLKCLNFLMDVPLHSLIGLIMTVIIVRLCVRFRNVLSDFDTWSLIQMFNSPQLTVSQENIAINPQDSSDLGDTLCIICHEHPKCILTLPCRHVCLCTGCLMRLFEFQRTCPICRTYIYHSVNVYL